MEATSFKNVVVNESKKSTKAKKKQISSQLERRQNRPHERQQLINQTQEETMNCCNNKRKYDGHTANKKFPTYKFNQINK